jgi:hypothetical protein
MLKAMAEGNGRKVLVIGLSFGNLDRFRQHPGDTFIRIEADPARGQPIDVMIFSGETEAHLAQLISGMVGPTTEVIVSDRLKQ